MSHWCAGRVRHRGGDDRNDTPMGLPGLRDRSAALQLATDVSPACITNHCVRSYLFGAELAAATGLRASVDYDDELSFQLCFCTTSGSRPRRRRPTLRGRRADAAAPFLREHGIGDEAVHIGGRRSPAHQRRPCAPIRAGSGGVAPRNRVGHQGFDKQRLSTGFADRVHADGRATTSGRIASAIAADTRANPMKAPPFSFPPTCIA